MLEDKSETTTKFKTWICIRFIHDQAYRTLESSSSGGGGGGDHDDDDDDGSDLGHFVPQWPAHGARFGIPVYRNRLLQKPGPISETNTSSALKQVPSSDPRSLIQSTKHSVIQ
jgi:hypothetical protein